MKVLSVKPLSGTKVCVSLSNGRRGIFDVSRYIRTDFFKELLDEEYFKKVKVFFEGIGWPNGQDLGPDTIAAGLVSKSTLSENNTARNTHRTHGPHRGPSRPTCGVNKGKVCDNKR